jgi:DNA repair protein RadD
MVGRGLRMHPGKDECAVLDYGENVVRHGPIDAMRIDDREKGQGDGEAPAKECPECRAVVLISLMVCPECGYRWPEPEPKIKPAAGNESILSEAEPTFHTITATRYYVHRKKDSPDAPPTLRVEYETGTMGEVFREWICFEHDGFARRKAELWWSARSSEPVPATVAEAVDLANAGALPDTKAIKWMKKPGEKFGSIVGYEIADTHRAVTEDTNYRVPDDEIPF